MYYINFQVWVWFEKGIWKIYSDLINLYWFGKASQASSYKCSCSCNQTQLTLSFRKPTYGKMGLADWSATMRHPVPFLLACPRWEESSKKYEHNLLGIQDAELVYTSYSLAIKKKMPFWERIWFLVSINGISYIHYNQDTWSSSLKRASMAPIAAALYTCWHWFIACKHICVPLNIGTAGRLLSPLLVQSM